MTMIRIKKVTTLQMKTIILVQSILQIYLQDGTNSKLNAVIVVQIVFEIKRMFYMSKEYARLMQPLYLYMPPALIC